MKNYYKTLGVRKDASEEEIRERWVKLMRKLHPDQRIGGAAKDERIKEINEAYQVLKHSSTRGEYDLKRAYDRQKRVSYVRRASIPIGLLTVLIIGSILYLKGIQITLQPNQRNQINQASQINSTVVFTHEGLDTSTHQRLHTSAQLVATEEEVRRFFANYTERYARMDLGSFISLFSSRAIQNHQDGLEAIRKLYDNFLKQSQEIRYNIDNLEIEIYQDGVEAKARYELVQMTKNSGDKRIWRGDIRWSLMKEDGVLKILSLDYQHQESP